MDNDVLNVMHMICTLRKMNILMLRLERFLQFNIMFNKAKYYRPLQKSKYKLTHYKHTKQKRCTKMHWSE